MKRAALALALALSASSANAAPVLFTSEAAYLAAVGATTTYVDFAGSPAATVAGGSFTGAVTFGSCTGGLATCGSSVLHNSDAITDLGGSPAPNGVAAVGGVFTAPVHAFAFHYVSGGLGSIELNGSTFVAVNSALPGFVGIVSSDPITGFVGINQVFPQGIGNDRYFIDDFRINDPRRVPEPVTLALVGLGLAAVARRRALRG